MHAACLKEDVLIFLLKHCMFAGNFFFLKLVVKELKPLSAVKCGHMQSCVHIGKGEGSLELTCKHTLSHNKLAKSHT